MKKICFIATISKTIEWFMLKQAVFLSENGYDVSIICNEDNEFKEKLPKNIHYFPISMKRGIDINGIKSLSEMRMIFKEEQFNIIEYTTPNASMYASIAGLTAGIKHRIYRQWGMVYIGFSGIKKSIFKLLERITCLCSTYVLPDSKGNLNLCRKQKFYSEKKSGVILNGSAAGVDLNRFDITKKDDWRNEIRNKYGINGGDFVVGFIGRINRDKGINELLRAFKSFSNEHSDAKLFLVGLSDRENEIETTLLRWAKNSNAVFFTGVTSEAEKFYASFDLFVLPSYREGFGSTIIEAESLGVPVVTTNIPGPSEAIIAHETGILIPKQDSDALYNAIKDLYDKPEKRIHFGQNGRVFAEKNFEQKQLFKANLNFLKSLE